MSKFANAPIPAANTIPTFVPTCGVSGCGNKTDHAHIVVIDREGRQRSGYFSKFGYEKSKELFLRDGFEFVHWVTRCDHCQLRDYRRAELMIPQIGKPREPGEDDER